MTRFTRHLAATTATALLSILLLAGAVGPAQSAPAQSSSAQSAPALAQAAGPVA